VNSLNDGLAMGLSITHGNQNRPYRDASNHYASDGSLLHHNDPAMEKVSWGSQQHKNKSGIEHSASLLKSVSLNATLALGQTSHFNIFNNGSDAQS